MPITSIARASIIDGRPVPCLTLHGPILVMLGAVLQARHERRPGPTVRDLMAVTGVKSPNAVVCNLKRLRQLGLIEWQTDKSRTLQPTCKVEGVS